MKSWRRVWVARIGWALALSPARAMAQDNYQSYPIGGRAGGMGGAAVALADDGAGVYYNPAGIAFAEHDSLSLDTSLYGFVGGHYANALGQGTNLEYNALNLVPSAATSISHLGESTPEHLSRWVFGFGVFTPNAFKIDQRTESRNGLATLFITGDEQFLLAGPTIAFRTNDRLSVGLSLMGGFHSLSTRAEVTDVRPTAMPMEQEFVQFTNATSARSLGLVATLGVRWQPTPSWSFGASVRIPTIHVWGSGEVFRRTVIALPSQGMAPRVMALTDDVNSREIAPARVIVGGAWRSGSGFALAGDVQMYLPVSFVSQDADDPALRQQVVRHFVINGSLGMEAHLTPRVPLRLGVYTDFSAAATPTPNGESSEQVHLVGATAAIGRISGQTSTVLGLIGAYGPARIVGTDLSSGTYSQVVADGSQYRVWLMYTGTFSR